MVERFAGARTATGNESNIENLIRQNLLMLENSLKVPTRQYFQANFIKQSQRGAVNTRQENDSEILEKIYPLDKSKNVTHSVRTSMPPTKVEFSQHS